MVLISAMPYKCSAAPYEAAMLLDDALHSRGIRDRCRVEVFTPEPHPMPVASPAMGQAVVEMLASKNIAFHPTRQVDTSTLRPASWSSPMVGGSLSTSWRLYRPTGRRGR